MCWGQWPANIKTEVDKKGAAFKSMMATLELVSLLLPFLTMPELMMGCHVTLEGDNKSLANAWLNKSAMGDITVSALVRALIILTTYLECRLYVLHSKRNTIKSYLATYLTRDHMANKAWPDMADTMVKEPPANLWDWLTHPIAKWQLGFKLVDNKKQRI